MRKKVSKGKTLLIDNVFARDIKFKHLGSEKWYEGVKSYGALLDYLTTVINFEIMLKLLSGSVWKIPGK